MYPLGVDPAVHGRLVDRARIVFKDGRYFVEYLYRYWFGIRRWRSYFLTGCGGPTWAASFATEIDAYNAFMKNNRVIDNGYEVVWEMGEDEDVRERV